MFGMANQLLAVIALAVVTTVLVNSGRGRYAPVTLVPMLFVATTTTTAGLLRDHRQVLEDDPGPRDRPQGLAQHRPDRDAPGLRGGDPGLRGRSRWVADAPGGQAGGRGRRSEARPDGSDSLRTCRVGRARTSPRQRIVGGRSHRGSGRPRLAVRPLSSARAGAGLASGWAITLCCCRSRSRSRSRAPARRTAGASSRRAARTSGAGR